MRSDWPWTMDACAPSGQTPHYSMDDLGLPARQEQDRLWIGMESALSLYFSEYRNITNPDLHAIFDEELLEEVRVRMDMGDSVVIGVDNNWDVRTSVLAKGLEDLGLRNVILSLYTPASPPATQNSNKKRVPIDAIWVSPSVEVTRAGYCPFDGASTMTSDHRMMWVELENSSIL